MTTDGTPGQVAPEPDEVRRCLEKILASSAFSGATRAQQFLRFVIAEALAGRAGEITEPVVAARVFNLSGGFDRRKNSIVRAEATHVRRRLVVYYQAAGASDSVLIGLPRGGYSPSIRTAAVGQTSRFAGFLSWLRRKTSMKRRPPGEGT
jgi:hypothetical protein